MSDIPTIRCPVCGAVLKVTTSTSKRGKVSLCLACPMDGRDFRAFINSQTFVRRVLASLESQTPMPGDPGEDDANSTSPGRSNIVLRRNGRS